MKIFNVEKGIKKAYVQLNDLMILINNVKSIPSSIVDKLLSYNQIIDENTRSNFIEFTDPKEVEYFEKLDWLVDYKEVRNYQDDDMEHFARNVLTEMNSIYKKFDNMTRDEKANSGDLALRYYLLNYEIKTLSEIDSIKKGTRQINFPNVPDSNGFRFGGDLIYEIRSSLDPNKVLFLRKDGNPITTADKIPQDILQVGIKLAIQNNNYHNDDFALSYSISDDRKYLVIEMDNYKEELEAENHIQPRLF